MNLARSAVVALRAAGAGLLCLGAAQAGAADGSFGELPPGAISTSLVSDVHVEICRDHLFDPSALQAPLPEGFRLVAASEQAVHEPGIAALVAADARRAGHALGSLCFLSAGTFTVDGVAVQPPGATAMAFWWARATGPRDPRMQGPAQWLQLASWYPRDAALDRSRIVATDPMAQFVELEVSPTGPGAWRLRLALPGQSVDAEVRASGPPVARQRSGPGFMSVPLSGTSADRFTVYTFYGHRHQAAEAAWTARGSGVLADALRIPGEAAVFETLVQQGWSARSGLYRFQR